MTILYIHAMYFSITSGNNNSSNSSGNSSNSSSNTKIFTITRKRLSSLNRDRQMKKKKLY